MTLLGRNPSRLLRYILERNSFQNPAVHKIRQPCRYGAHVYLKIRKPQVFHLYIADVPVYINDDGYGDGCFASGNPDGEQGEEKAFQLFGEEITVEHGKVDIH